MLRLSHFSLFCSVLAIAGCATVPKLCDAPVARDVDQLATPQSFAAGAGLFPQEGWWKSFQDPALDQLMAEALAQSPDIAAAMARLRAADAMVQMAGSASSPQVSAEASLGGQRMSQNMSFPPAFVPNAVQSTGRLAGNISFDPDLWGRNRAALKAATSEAAAAAVDAAQVKLMLTTSIAATYADLGRLFDERDVAEEALRIRDETENLVGLRVRHGLDNKGDLGLAQSRMAAARGELKGIDEAIAITRNALAALASAGPDRGLAIGRPTKAASQALALPDNLALNLLGRRPDLVAARLRGEAAASRSDVARAEFYPDINLSAVAGLQSVGLDSLLKGSSAFTTFGPALRLPIFNGGALQANYKKSRAEQEMAIAHYDAVLLSALHETADAIAHKRALGPRLADAQAGLAAARESQRVAQLRYRNGLANLLQVLTAEDATIAAQRAVASLSATDRLLDIMLIRALGGGFVEEKKAEQSQ